MAHPPSTFTIFIKNSGILGFDCTHQYAHIVAGTYYYPRLLLTLKGIDGVLFTIFRTLSLTVHVQLVLKGTFSKEVIYLKETGVAPKFRDLITIREEIGGEVEESEVSVYQDWY